MALQITGKVEVIGQTVQIASKNGGNPFSKRELVLTCNRFDPYTGEIVSENHPKFEFSGSRCEKLDHFKEGEMVTVDFVLQGNWIEGQDGMKKNITNVVGYNITPYQRQCQQAEPATQTGLASEPSQSQTPPPLPPMDKLPF